MPYLSSPEQIAVQSTLTSIAQSLGLTKNVVTALCVVVGILTVGSILRVVTIRSVEPAKRRERLGSLLVWWVGLAIVVIVASGSLPAGVCVFGLISCLGLREYLRMTARLRTDSSGNWEAYAAILFGYFAIWRSDETLFLIAVPLIGGLLLASRLIVAGKTTGYLAAVAGLVWGALLLGYFLPHAVQLFSLPPRINPIGGNAGWFVFLIILTEADDIFQALWGRRFGKHKITPQISPNKSLEGLLGGIVSTVALGALLAPWLTPLAEPWILPVQDSRWSIPYAGAIAACLLISMVGFLGDLNMSALKRDAGVKDTGNWLPGQGGVLDRIDSLTFTAPAFYYFVKIIYL